MGVALRRGAPGHRGAAQLSPVSSIAGSPTHAVGSLGTRTAISGALWTQGPACRWAKG